MKNPVRLALIGYGAMARALQQRLAHGTPTLDVGAVLVQETGVVEPPLLEFSRIDQLLDWRPTLVAECAGHSAVTDVVPHLLGAGIDVVIASVGALSDDRLLSHLMQASQDGGGRLIVPSGAVGGLDALRAARDTGLDRVVYTGKKPPRAWAETPASDAFDLDAIVSPTTIFEGSAREAARLYPKNANVTAAVALAGAGFDDTTVRLLADPTADRNEHEISARGAFGEINIRLRNVPLPENPKTSMLAALSLELEVRRVAQVLAL
ncbi:aspartate dehydrogenase [Bosea beijingensis]|uniref:aspartate dehydrogenase n=1 Tax=Bosea beijingensis TaxID=3068632 RepID=UPI0027419A14|nr:aspartate dehydrogenase [Bosea sp. REN20]